MSDDEEDSQKKRRKIGEEQSFVARKSPVLFTFNNIDFTSDDSIRLDQGNWLNDNVLSFWIWEIKKKMKKTEKVFIFDSSFMAILLKGDTYDYGRVKRWTTNKEIDIFENNFLLIPVHVSGNHWLLLVANLQERVVTIMDSLDQKGRYSDLKEVLVNYLEDEFKTVKGISPLDQHFEVVQDLNAPEQQNSYDCGIFVLIFIERIVRHSLDIEENRSSGNKKSKIIGPISEHEALDKRIEILGAVRDEMEKKETEDRRKKK
jgi:sentrin-specific protease 1